MAKIWWDFNRNEETFIRDCGMSVSCQEYEDKYVHLIDTDKIGTEEPLKETISGYISTKEATDYYNTYGTDIFIDSVKLGIEIDKLKWKREASNKRGIDLCNISNEISEIHKYARTQFINMKEMVNYINSLNLKEEVKRKNFNAVYRVLMEHKESISSWEDLLINYSCNNDIIDKCYDRFNDLCYQNNITEPRAFQLLTNLLTCTSYIEINETSFEKFEKILLNSKISTTLLENELI